MAIIKNLTARNCTALGIVRRADLDFEDDGNNFRGFDYKGLPITVLRSNEYDEIFLSIRNDYLDHLYTFKEWNANGGYALTDKFNPISEIDTDDLIATLEAVIALIDKLNHDAETATIDYDRIEKALNTEIAYAEESIELFKTKFNWYDAGAYDLKRLIGYSKSLEGRIKAVKTNIANLKTLRKDVTKHYIERLDEYGDIEFGKNDFYVSELRKAVEGNK